MTAKPRIGAVVLTYNSEADLPACLEGLLAQEDVELRLVVVDNASTPAERAEMEDIFSSHVAGGVVCGASEATPERVARASAAFLRNDRNVGYSAGNNIGARLAVGLGCEAVLIVNPDVRIHDPRYLAKLWGEMRADPGCAVGASRIVNLDGKDEHPIREAGFWEELLWVRQMGPRALRPGPYVQPPDGPDPVEAEKLHGCCLLIRSSFLEDTGYLDEGVFLYSEEPILAAKVRAAGLRLMLFPRIEAVHAHVAATKGNSSRRMGLFIRSRLYYLDRYAGYGPFALAALHFSYGVFSMLHAAKARLSRAGRAN